MDKEQIYRRWKKGEDPHKLAKEKGVTRERMRWILQKMEQNIPLVDQIEELERLLGLADDQRREWEHHCKTAEAERDEALNQLDSARHSVAVLEKRLAKLKGEDDE